MRQFMGQPVGLAKKNSKRVGPPVDLLFKNDIHIQSKVCLG